ncbi:unnamed protein product [Cylicostephanus goldi]|uniref:Uncharacterized protein n=1 Tax=Cylicostephanus goldi TaxID=71465 RepID=A0A3P6TGW6_CYLGO|nr:unnamed protein product [Cylicostephanus goldi]
MNLRQDNVQEQSAVQDEVKRMKVEVCEENEVSEKPSKKEKKRKDKIEKVEEAVPLVSGNDETGKKKKKNKNKEVRQ